jgi:hypothetical protein
LVQFRSTHRPARFLRTGLWFLGGFRGAPILGLATNVAAPINGVISCVDAENDPAFNPTNHQPSSALLWFKSWPSDGWGEEAVFSFCLCLIILHSPR